MLNNLFKTLYTNYEVLENLTYLKGNLNKLSEIANIPKKHYTCELWSQIIYKMKFLTKIVHTIQPRILDIAYNLLFFIHY